MWTNEKNKDLQLDQEISHCYGNEVLKNCKSRKYIETDLIAIQTRKSNFDKCRFEIKTSSCDSDRFLFTCRFIITRSKTCPAAKPFKIGKLRHFVTHFRYDSNGRIAIDTRNSTKKCNQSLVLFNHRINDLINLRNFIYSI